MLQRFRVFPALLVLFFAGCSVLCQEPQKLGTVPQQQLDVIKVVLAQETAWNNGDLDAFAQAYKDSPDILFISGSVSRGFAGLLESYKRDYPNRAAMGTLGFSELEVHKLDENFAVVVGRYRLERTKKDGGSATGLSPVDALKQHRQLR